MNAPIDVLFSLVMAVALGGLIGLEREMRTKEQESETQFGGLRTFSMLSLLGYLGGYLTLGEKNFWFLGILFFLAVSFMLVSHAYLCFRKDQIGITSELSALACFVLGILIAHGDTFLAIAASVLFTGLLAFKKWLHTMAREMSGSELVAILKFLIVSFIILQVMPSQWIDPWGFFDWRPKIIWLMVVFVAAIRFVGYFLAKFIGSEKGIILSGVVGGFVSSTAVTSGLSLESKGQTKITSFLMAILVATGIMFFRVILEISFLSRDLLSYLAYPLLAMGLSAFAITAVIHFFQKKMEKKLDSPITITQPFEMKSALIFGAFFLGILLLSDKIGSVDAVANAGLIITGGIAGLTDVDAITLAMSNLADGGGIPFALAARVVFVAVIVNTLVKGGIVFLFGSRRLFRGLILSLAVILGVGAATFFLTAT